MGSIPQRSIRLALYSTPSHLPIVRAATEEAARLVGFSDSDCHQVVLAVDEALANIIEHAYEGRDDGPIEVTLTPLGGCETRGGAEDRCIGLEVVLRDRGRTVDPSAIRPPAPTSELRPGGLGVHIIHTCMDDVAYTVAEGGGSQMQMIKLLPGESLPMSKGASRS